MIPSASMSDRYDFSAGYPVSGMVDVLTVLAIGLLVAGIVGTIVPLVPGGLLSLSGLYLYWWNSGFTEPGLIALTVLTGLALLTLFAEFFAGSIAARAGGASWRTTAIAAAVGITLMLVSGPVGLLAGLFGTVFVLEWYEGNDVDASLTAAWYTTIGVLASTVVQVLLTATILGGFLIAIFVF